MGNFIIFDFDGTIVKSKELIIEIYNEIADRENYKKIGKLDIARLSDLSIMQRLKKLNVPVYKVPSIALEVRKKYKRDLHNLRIEDDVTTLLYNLQKEGFKLGIISSNERSNIIEFLNLNDINIFDAVLSEKNLFGKDHAINNFISKLNLEIKSTIYIGDEVRDIIACKKVGIKVIAVTWGYDSQNFLRQNNPDFIANNPEEIVKIVNNHFEKNEPICR